MLYKYQKITYTFIVFLLFATNLFSQNMDSIVLSIGYDTLSAENIPMLPEYDGSKGDVPFKAVSLKKYCPNVGNQGSTGACSGWAVGFGAMTIHHALQNHLTKKELIQFNAFSPSFIYNQILKNQDCSKSVTMLDATQLLQTTGDCFMSDFDAAINCNVKPKAEVMEKAAKHKIQASASLFAPNTAKEVKIALIKSYLADSLPVVVNIQVPKSFLHIPYGTSFWKPKEVDEFSGYGHFMVVVGYDDNKQSFELMNSWGNEWGSKGFINIAYEDFTPICKAAYIIVPEYLKSKELLNKIENVKNKAKIATKNYNAVENMTAQFEFRKITQVEPTILAEKQNVIFDQTTNVYFLEKNQFVKDKYQIKVSDMSAGRYLYVFSCDGKEEIKLHWPRENNNPKLAKFVPSAKATLTIPDLYKALLAKQKGDNFVVILLSDKELQNVNEQLRSIKDCTRYNIVQKIGDAFGIDKKQYTSYQKDNIAATMPVNKIQNNAQIMPLVLCVEVK